MRRTARAQVVELVRRGQERVLLLLLARQPLEQQPFADALRRDDDLPRFTLPDDLVQHHGPVGQQRPARRGDGGDRAQSLGVDAFDEVGEGPGLGGRDHIAVHDVERIVPLPHVQLRQRPPGASDRVERPALEGLDGRTAGDELAGDLLRPFGRVLRRVGQGQAAERHRDAMAELQLLDLDQLEGAAAEVAHDPVGLVERRCDPERREFGLAAAADEFDPGADRRLGGAQEVAAVASVARRRGRQHVDVAHAHVAAQDLEAAQRGERPIHGLGGQEAAGRDPLAEAAQDLLVEDRHQRARQGLVGHEPNRIRPDIDDRDRCTRAMGRRAHPRRRAGRGSLIVVRAA